MPNRELFKKIYDQITTHPEHHWQDVWEAEVSEFDSRRSGDPLCGTARCVAGWALHLSGRSVEDAINAGHAVDVLAADLLDIDPLCGTAREMFSTATTEDRAVELVRQYAGIPE
jgi:hypothetical protein